MSRGGGRRRVLSSEERVLWTSVTKAVAPLRPPAPHAADADAANDANDITAPAPPRQAPPPAAASPPPLAPLGRRLKQRVARGREAIEARLDLHGLTQAQAHSALLRFLRGAHARDARLVLVITGKGAAGDSGRGVLRRHVPQWLGLPEFRALVVGFEDAHAAHGGAGALYVRLRRPRG